MISFEIYLIAEDGATTEVGSVLDFIGSSTVEPIRGSPSSFVYRNGDTRVQFTVTLGEELLSGGQRGEPDLLNPPVPEHADALVESSLSRARHDEEAFDGDDVPSFQTAPVTVSVPLFHPTFFLTEALAFLEPLAQVGKLKIACLSDGEEDSGSDPQLMPVTNEALFNAWLDLHRSVYPQLIDAARTPIQFWTKEECAHFYDYNVAREELQHAFNSEGVEVVPIQLARHEGRVKTLCVWRVDRPVVLPATDLILVERPRRRGLFGGRRVEEFIVTTPEVWTRLQPFTEQRYDPVPMLICCHPPESSSSLVTDIIEAGSESVDNAQPTGFGGITDLDLATRETTANSDADPEMLGE